MDRKQRIDTAQLHFHQLAEPPYLEGLPSRLSKMTWGVLLPATEFQLGSSGAGL